jgi:hypothetical protein
MGSPKDARVSWRDSSPKSVDSGTFVAKQTTTATADQFRRAIHDEPFRPFVFRLVDGTRFEVKHPEHVSVPPTPRARELTYYVVTDDDGEEYRSHWIDLGLVAEVICPSDT